jgi:hypothetical protein
MAERMLHGEERLRFLVWLAQIADYDKSKLKPGDLVNTIHDLRRYVDDEKETEHTLKRAERDFSVLQTVLSSVKKAVETVADKSVALFPAGKRPPVRLDARGDGQPRQYYGQSGELLDVVLPHVFEDLRSWSPVGEGRIRRCKDKGCRKLFYAGRRDQEFCSRGCAARTGVRVARAQRKKAAKGAA